MANRVFEDRLGLWIVNPANLPARLAKIAAFPIVDVFLPRDAQRSDLERVRAAGLSAHLWVAVDGLNAADYAARTLDDIARLKPGALELNIELGTDPPLAEFVDDAVAGVRAKYPRMRIRVNVGAWKGFGLTSGRFTSDPNLYACEQSYHGDMAPVSQADVYANLLAYGIHPSKATVCYGAAGPVSGSPGRVCTLPDLSKTKRGVIFQDDLMAEAGLLP